MQEIKTKTRNWFLTINQNAECYLTFADKLKGFEKVRYSYILHDKDNEEQPHFHVCVLFENARTFETMQKHFLGAHIEIMESKYKSFRYLLHLDDTDKYQYDLKEVMQRGNNVEYYSTHDEYIKLDTESLLENIQNGTIRSFFDTVKLFGLKQSTIYRNSINQLLEQVNLMEVSFTSQEEVASMQCHILNIEMLNDDLIKRVEDLSSYVDRLEKVNNDLLVKCRLLEHYEKIVKERGLL